MIIIARFEHEDTGKAETLLFYSWDEYHTATFSPFINTTDKIILSPFTGGKTYQQGKARARAYGVVYSGIVCDSDFTYGELSTIQYYFEKLAKRFGLLREFRENGIL